MRVDGRVRRLDDRGMRREAEVVVRAEVEDVALALALADGDLGGLRRRDDALLLVEAGLPDLAHRGFEDFLGLDEHGLTSSAVGARGKRGELDHAFTRSWRLATRTYGSAS
jgi:hypothetical protein